MFMYSVFCRLYQGAFRLVSPFLPWREPVLLEGRDALLGLPGLLKKLSVGKVLVVTDKGITKAGLMDKMLESLGREGIHCSVYDDTVPNPTIGNIEDAYALYKDGACQAIIAFGGGSAMDCAKGVGARAARPGRRIQAMRGLLKVGRSLPPLIAVPTTAGTGSEATLAAVVSNPDTHEKYAINDPVLIPRYAVLDPGLTLGLPAHITSTTGMDALTHAVEAFIGRSNTKKTKEAAVRAARLIKENLLAVYERGDNIEARENMLKAAYLAGFAFTRAYVGYVHAIAHTLGGFYGVPHGLANAVALPYVLEYFGSSAVRPLADLARAALWCGDGLSDQEAARHFIDSIKTMNRSMNIPEHIPEIREADIPLMAKRALREANPLYPVPRILGKKDLTVLYRLIAGI